jgi:lipopolysaccharide/colanic/teichoic acid biosynthesis glycosyltransferase
MDMLKTPVVHPVAVPSERPAVASDKRLRPAPLLPLDDPWWKRAVDRSFALALLVVTAPFLGLSMLLVKLTSPGPAIYSQTRLGKNGRPFTIYKIRSMTHNCEGQSVARWSTPGDMRVTPVGRFLRLSHLDELPQLWNVLRGDMSLVGPRPEPPEFVPQLERQIPHYRERLRVLPGLTGLAQFHLPPDTDMASVARKL